MIEVAGFKIYRKILSLNQCHRISSILKNQCGQLYQIRDVLNKCPQIIDILYETDLIKLPYYNQIIRSVLFQKPKIKNWLVPWHQDVLIQVKEKINSKNYGPWSLKENINHVQPPIEIMNRIWSFRIHLDRCTINDGPLKVIPESHLNGYLTTNEIKIESLRPPTTIECDIGDVLVFHPLLLHSSSKLQSDSNRAVLHLECSTQELPNGLTWANTFNNYKNVNE